MKTTNQPSLPLVGGGGTSSKFKSTSMFLANRLKVVTKLGQKFNAAHPARNKFSSY